MLGPFATASRRMPIHQVSLLSHARIDVHDNNDDNNDNAWQRGPLWPHRMGPKNEEINASKIYSPVGKFAERAKNWQMCATRDRLSIALCRFINSHFSCMCCLFENVVKTDFVLISFTRSWLNSPCVVTCYLSVCCTARRCRIAYFADLKASSAFMYIGDRSTVTVWTCFERVLCSACVVCCACHSVHTDRLRHAVWHLPFRLII